jgi:hypothetical protein
MINYFKNGFIACKDYVMTDYFQYGFIVRVVERFFNFFQQFHPFIQSPVEFEKEYQTKTKNEKPKLFKKYSKRVDTYISICILCEAIIVIILANKIDLSYWFKIIICILCFYRILDIFQSGVNITIFNQLRLKKLFGIISNERTVILIFINYIEIAICFSAIYAANISYLCGAKTWADAFYFSIVTQLTIGYGEIVPLGCLKMTVVLQGFLSLFFVILTISRIVSFLPNIPETSKRS